MVKHVPLSDMPPPRSSVGLSGWIRRNLFSTWYNGVFTCAAVYLLYLLLPPFFRWTVLDANFAGMSREACSGQGACWIFIKVRFLQFMFGFYPADQYWRPICAFLLFGLLAVWLLLKKTPRKGLVAVLALFAYPPLAFILFYGGMGLPVVETHQWGGLMLTLIISSIGMFFALPCGIVLALGRRSSMVVARSFSVVFIELWRGVPLITILFMSSVMLPIFMPPGLEINKLLRALIGIICFQSAYMAEVVRGGLQAMPKGQYEAADSLGLGYWQATVLIILPQALKTVIPGIVNTFIALFKDTTLVLIIGLFDILAIIQSAFTDPKWLGFSREGYLFAAAVFWVFCFSMSRYSQYLERALHTGQPRR